MNFIVLVPSGAGLITAAPDQISCWPLYYVRHRGQSLVERECPRNA